MYEQFESKVKCVGGTNSWL